MLNPHFEIESVFHNNASIQSKIDRLLGQYNSKSEEDKNEFLLVLIAEFVASKETCKRLSTRRSENA